MGILFAVLVVWVALALLGFAAHALWWIAVVVAVFWLAGFAFRSGEGSNRHWYRW
jgi:hypothetical protein